MEGKNDRLQVPLNYQIQTKKSINQSGILL